MSWLGPVGFGVLFALYVLVVMPWLLDRYEDEFPWRRRTKELLTERLAHRECLTAHQDQEPTP